MILLSRFLVFAAISSVGYQVAGAGFAKDPSEDDTFVSIVSTTDAIAKTIRGGYENRQLIANREPVEIYPISYSPCDTPKFLKAWSDLGDLRKFASNLGYDQYTWESDEHPKWMEGDAGEWSNLNETMLHSLEMLDIRSEAIYEDHFDSWYWDEIANNDPSTANALNTLGWTRDSWDSWDVIMLALGSVAGDDTSAIDAAFPLTSDLQSMSWDELDLAQKNAAETLGYSCGEWMIEEKDGTSRNLQSTLRDVHGVVPNHRRVGEQLPCCDGMPERRLDDRRLDCMLCPPTPPPVAPPVAPPVRPPTPRPTSSPTKVPTSSPTGSPTDLPTGSPTSSPTGSPTSSPTGSPTDSPTSAPTSAPTPFPSSRPTPMPTTEKTTQCFGRCILRDCIHNNAPEVPKIETKAPKRPKRTKAPKSKEGKRARDLAAHTSRKSAMRRHARGPSSDKANRRRSLSYSDSDSVPPLCDESPGGCVQKCDSMCTGCFPSDATVNVLGEGDIRIDQLKLGDQVLTSTGYSQVYAFSQASPDEDLWCAKLETSHGATLELSLNHIVLVDGKFPKMAKDVVVGDTVEVYLGEPGTSSIQSNVTAISHTAKSGAYAPLTKDGTIIVDKILTSVHSIDGPAAEIKLFGVILVDIHRFKQMLFSPLRVLCMLSFEEFCSDKHYDEEGTHNWDSVTEHLVDFVQYDAPDLGTANFLDVSVVFPFKLLLLFGMIVASGIEIIFSISFETYANGLPLILSILLVVTCIFSLFGHAIKAKKTTKKVD